MQVRLSIPYPYNGGEYWVSQQVTGPRGGKHWEKVYSQPATGGEIRGTLEPGMYKETWWANGWPTSHTFQIVEREPITDQEGSQYKVFQMLNEHGDVVDESQELVD